MIPFFKPSMESESQWCYPVQPCGPFIEVVNKTCMSLAPHSCRCCRLCYSLLCRRHGSGWTTAKEDSPFSVMVEIRCVLYCIVLYCMVLCYVLWSSFVSYHIMSYHMISYHLALYCILRSETMLHYVLFLNILYCIIVYNVFCHPIVACFLW